MDKKAEVNLDDLMRVCNVLDSLRVSLDRIGAINQQGRDKMRLALDEYFTSGVYKEIADSWLMLAKIIQKEISREEFLQRTKEKKIPYFELKKY